jgi:D-alanyl-D-alanine carboxypeptidase/D-alanyl-D-alanine-endopeptidase (penicillin-binding protein 4)
MTTIRPTGAAAVLALALAFAAASTAAAPAMPPGVAAALRASGLPTSSFGIDIRPVDAGADGELFALNAERDFLLASTTKLVTSLAALDLLGADHRWRTGATATGPVANGRLAGDLVISGGAVGLTAAELLRWFKQMRAQGLSEIGGNIVLDKVALLHERDPAQAPTTAVESQPNGPPDPKTYNVGKLLVSVKPTSGERASVVVKPRPANVLVVNDVFMGGGCGAWARWRSAEETRGGAPLQLWVRGRWDRSCGAEDIAYVKPPEDVRLAPELGAAPAPPVASPLLVAELWAESGGKLRGRVVEGGEGAGVRRGGNERWSSEVATPLAEVMREMNKTSNNAAARSVLLSLGSDATARPGKLSTAQARMRTWLRTQGLADGDIHVDEGSGQSRAERGKPRALVQLLVNAWRSGASQAFVDSLPIAGVDGTLRHRMRNGSASGQAFLKTGTLSDTRALAGYVRGKSGRVYAVAAIVTHAQAAKGTPALDALIEWVAREG